jgi:glycosyltransferase involved in cell wall biosynthesis
MRVALVENFGADFVGARLRYSLFLKDNGVSVTVIIPNDGHRKIIENYGLEVLEVGSNIRGTGILKKINYALKLRSIFRSYKYDIIHFYRMQPNIIGTFIAGLYTNSKIVNHVTGLGIIFTKKDFKHYLQKLFVQYCYKVNSYLFSPYIIFQNEQDVFDLGLINNSIVIKGSAVNESVFNHQILDYRKSEIINLFKELGNNIKETVVFLFVSRLLREKGVIELIQGFIDAQKETNTEIFLLVAGWSDNNNPSSVKPIEIETQIKNQKNIKFLGKRSDIELLIGISDVCVLPTYYREGTPRFLLESMAVGKAIITTNMPGCNHLIPSGNNGELIEPKSAEEIKNAILRILNKNLLDLGANSRSLYQKRFSENVVYPKILQLYHTILK